MAITCNKTLPRVSTRLTWKTAFIMHDMYSLIQDTGTNIMCKERCIVAGTQEKRKRRGEDEKGNVEHFGMWLFDLFHQ